MDRFKPDQLQFSDVAISHFSGLLKKEDGNKSIRIGVKKAGCSGYEYFFEYAETHAEDDTLIKHDNCTFLIDPKSLTPPSATLAFMFILALDKRSDNLFALSISSDSFLLLCFRFSFKIFTALSVAKIPNPFGIR